jgi:prepilin-type N-terminal cleavage/methylation domain-containing protein
MFGHAISDIQPEIRSSKSEIRNKSQIRRKKTKKGDSGSQFSPFPHFGIRACFGFRISDFGFDSARLATARGFTLIEVLIALVILSTGIVLVLQAFQTSMVALSESRDAVGASLLREQRLAVGAAAARDGEAPRAVDSGRFESRYSRFSWEVTSGQIPTTLSVALLQPYTWHEVTAAVQRDGSSRRYTAGTIIRVPVVGD